MSPTRTNYRRMVPGSPLKKQTESPIKKDPSTRKAPSRRPAVPKKEHGSIPSLSWQFVLESRKGFKCLTPQEDIPVARPGPYECLVRIEAVSLNYRDLGVADGGYPFPVTLSIVPCSDGAGYVVAVGEKVTEFKVDDKVCTLFNQDHQAGPLTPKIMGSGLGALRDGVLRRYGVFPETGLIKSPECRGWTEIEACTLPCAALTAWNALYGLESKAIKSGQYVLTQGTGGVSCFAMQFARAAGAIVVATTGSDKKGEQLKSKMKGLQVINYKDEPNWGEAAKKLTPNGEGFDHIIEIGGPNTMAQSLKAVKMDGVINVIGFVGGQSAKDQPGMLDALATMCTVRGLFVGSRAQFKDMVRAIEASDIEPIISATFDDITKDKVQEAYTFTAAQKHMGKVVLDLRQASDSSV